MVAGILEKKDGMCMRKTGDGKTYCFTRRDLRPFVDSQCGFTINIPHARSGMGKASLKYLIKSNRVLQVEEAKRCDIKAVSLCRENLHNEPKIALSAAAGEYRILFVTPELLTMENAVFKRLGSSKVVRAWLGRVIIDEAHLCHQW